MIPDELWTFTAMQRRYNHAGEEVVAELGEWVEGRWVPGRLVTAAEHITAVDAYRARVAARAAA